MATWSAPLGADDGLTYLLQYLCDVIDRQHPTIGYLASITMTHLSTLRTTRFMIELGNRELVVHLPDQLWTPANSVTDLVVYLTSLLEWGRFWQEVDPLWVNPDQPVAPDSPGGRTFRVPAVPRPPLADPFPRRLIRETP